MSIIFQTSQKTWRAAQNDAAREPRVWDPWHKIFWLYRSTGLL